MLHGALWRWPPTGLYAAATGYTAAVPQAARSCPNLAQEGPPCQQQQKTILCHAEMNAMAPPVKNRAQSAVQPTWTNTLSECEQSGKHPCSLSLLLLSAVSAAFASRRFDSCQCTLTTVHLLNYGHRQHHYCEYRSVQPVSALGFNTGFYCQSRQGTASANLDYICPASLPLAMQSCTSSTEYVFAASADPDC